MTMEGKRDAWRLFAAVPISEEARARAAAVLKELAASGADAKWVEPAHLHLTLAFLGATEPSRVAQVSAALKRAASGKAAFALHFDRLGAFPSVEAPTVFWLGAGDGSDALRALAEPLISELSAAGLMKADEAGRLFAVHLTLGRVRGTRGLRRLKGLLKDMKFAPFETPVERVVLYRSRLSEAGPSYEELAEVRLG